MTDGNEAPSRLDTGSKVDPWRLALLLSGTGRTLENLLATIARGELDARVVAVVSSVAGARGLQVADSAGIRGYLVPRRAFESDAAFSTAVYDTLMPHQPHLLLLAGFLRRLVVPPAWEGRILNIHPALLPEAAAYAAGRGRYGVHVHAAVLANGDTRTGATVHIVDNDYDAGPPVLRAEIPVAPHDTPATLAARVFAAERALYPAAIRRYVTAHPELRGDRG
ncbi:MAG: phosphoribosylglycinamide formyltransferase [Chloroflexia bacterium]|nr:phosphoribosylglycinamide formyltransferase [Chloroflexia bacterium]